MSDWLSLVGLIIGVALLMKGADFLVMGASSLASRMSVSETVVGLTVVAFGTSAPELLVSLIAAIQKRPDAALGNVIGSNIFNILLILGVAGVIHPLRIEKNTVWREIPFSFLAVVALFFLSYDGLFGQGESWISRNDGMILLLFFVLFMIYTFGIPRVRMQDEMPVKLMSSVRTFVYIVGGLAGLTVGGRLTISGAITMAELFGMSERLMGLTVLAIGTSLPELFTSAVAASRGKSEIAVGNIVGSNIFNIFLILGVTATVSPLRYNPALNVDFLVLTVASAVLFVTMFTGKRRTLDRWEAILLIGLAVLYLSVLIWRN